MILMVANFVAANTTIIAGGMLRAILFTFVKFNDQNEKIKLCQEGCHLGMIEGEPEMIAPFE